MIRFVLALVVCLIMTACQYTPNNDAMTFAENPVIAHRGAWKEKGLPENSIASLKHAIALQCTGSEFDVRMTADDVLIVTHDPEYHGLHVESSTYEQLSKQKLSNGEILPKLSDFITAGMEDNTSTALICEIKPSKIEGRNLKITQAVMALVDELHAENYIGYYISFGYDILKEIKRINPSAKVQYLDGSKSPERLKADGMDGLDYYINIFKNHPEWIEDAKEKDLVLNAWTVNDSEDIDFFLANDFEYITTNEPELVFDRFENGLKSQGWTLVWSDEFNKPGKIDSTKWAYETGLKRNQERQFYTDSLKNVRVEKGHLILEAHKEQIKNPAFESKTAKSWKQNWEYADYTSGSITTKNLAEWTYGRIDIRAKLPEGVGLWPAFWMIGANYDEVGWPASGEIDIMEHVGFDPDSIFGTIHTKSYNHMRGTQKGKSIYIEKPYESFHIFTLEWTPEAMDFILDGQVYNHIENEHKTSDEWPFDQNFHLKLNIAVGGMLGGRQGIDDSKLPSAMLVDYVRVFKKMDQNEN